MEMILLVRRVAWNVNGTLHRAGINCIIEHVSRVHPSIRERVQFSGSLSPMTKRRAPESTSALDAAFMIHKSSLFLVGLD